MLISEGEFDPTRQRSGHSGPRRTAFPCRVLVLDGGFRPAVQADGPARSRRPSVPRACCARTARIGLAGKFSMKVTKSAGSALSSMRSHTCRSTDTPPESAAAGADRCGSAEARRHEHEVAAVAPPRSRSFRLRLIPEPLTQPVGPGILLDPVGVIESEARPGSISARLRRLRT